VKAANAKTGFRKTRVHILLQQTTFNVAANEKALMAQEKNSKTGFCKHLGLYRTMNNLQQRRS